MKRSLMNTIHKNQDKPIIHLHIGTHKTGTTSLQKFLDQNSEQLKKLGFLYPKAGWYHYSQHLLPFQLKGTTPYNIENVSDTVWKELIEEIEKSKLKNIILSSEVFSTLNKQQIKTLGKFLENFDVKIYLYLRRQDELFESIYNQQIKGWRNSKRNNIGFFLKKMKNLYQHFDYYDLVSNWVQIFKSNNVIIRPYHREHVKDTIDDFLNLLQIDKQEQKNFQWSTNKNQAISAKALEMIRLSKFVEEDLKVREKIFHLANTFFPGNSQNKTLLLSNQREDITEKYRLTNKKLIKEYFTLGESYLLASPLEDNKAEKLTHQDLLKVIASLVSEETENRWFKRNKLHLKIFDKISRFKK